MTTETDTWVQENRSAANYDDSGKFQRKTIRSLICHRTFKGWLFLILFATSVPVLVYYFVINQGSYETNDSYTCLVQEEFRVTCGKENITAEHCKSIECCYDKSTSRCYHYLPSKYSYDKETNQYVPRQSRTPYGTNSLPKLRVAVNEIDDNRVSVILFQENVNITENSINSNEKNYKVYLVEEKLMVEIYRNNGDLLLTTAKGPLIASENYWEWSFHLTNQSLFGLNRTLINVPINSTFTKVLYKNKFDHSSLPVLWGYFNKNFHGVAIKHGGPLEITILPSNMVILKSLTGTLIELELSVGPTPKHLHDQQAQNDTPPPFWMLKTHLCRKGSTVNLTQLLADLNLDSQANINCIHENLLIGMMMDDNTNNNNSNALKVRNIISNIKEQGSHFVLAIPPHILQNSTTIYDKSVELDILFKYNKSVYTGQYLNEITVYPDYTHSNNQLLIEEIHNLISAYMDTKDIDGIVLYDNWPVNENFTMDSTIQFPYLSEELKEAMSYTIQWNATSIDILHIENHNSYGTSQILSFQNYFNSIPIMSASNAFGRAEPSIVQNVDASWSELEMMVDNVLFNSITGNHLVSLPVCGDTASFTNSLQETLCLRWYLVAATMPLFRISSHQPLREPSYLYSDFAKNVALSAIDLRNTLLPYYYTILSKNEPVLRPMFYEYYKDEETFSLRNQYMIGDNLLIAHPFSMGRTKLQIYLPSDNQIWYEFWGGQLFNSTQNSWISFDIVETDFIAFLSQGSIIPLKEENTLNLIVALNCTSNPCEASGSLFEYDYDYMNFLSNETALTITNIPVGSCNYTLGSINIYYYENGNSFNSHAISNEDLCTDNDNLTIFY